MHVKRVEDGDCEIAIARTFAHNGRARDWSIVECVAVREHSVEDPDPFVTIESGGGDVDEPLQRR